MITTMIHSTRPIFYSLLVLTFVLQTLIGSTWLLIVEGSLAIVCLAISMHDARRMFQIAGSLFIAAGIACMIWGQLPISQLPLLMTSNVMLISLLYMLPFINRVIRIGGYDRHLSRWLHVKSGNLGSLYVRSLAVSYLLSLFLFFAALPLVHKVLKKHLQHQEQGLANRFIASAILRGFGIVALWSPVEPLVATAVLITGVSYMSLLPWMLGLSVLMFIAGGLWGLSYRRIKDEAMIQATAKAPSWPKTITFLFALLLLITLAFLLQSALHLSFFTAMTFVLLPFSIVWAIALRRLGRFVAAIRLHGREGIVGLRHLLVLFLSFGFFNSAVSKSPLFHLVEGSVQSISHWPSLLLIVIFLVCFLLPVAGIHPLVVMGVFGFLLQPVLVIMNPLSIAMVLITSCLCSSFMGTFNSTVTIMSGLLRVNPYRITAWNLGFGLLFGGTGVLVSYLLL
ncbi:hypothetical protein [Paenibacillus sp. FSL H7-0331]|uniref:hypothetical protein n=1 Tax=Paenibacillus sp. FSL H7-0331 TaxID=1920421 RepID=UPI002116D76B|nr:hypothetical protein [Paenibacillus sp. FSL H7-0331]